MTQLKQLLLVSRKTALSSVIRQRARICTCSSLPPTTVVSRRLYSTRRFSSNPHQPPHQTEPKVEVSEEDAAYWAVGLFGVLIGVNIFAVWAESKSDPNHSLLRGVATMNRPQPATKELPDRMHDEYSVGSNSDAAPIDIEHREKHSRNIARRRRDYAEDEDEGLLQSETSGRKFGTRRKTTKIVHVQLF